MRVPSTSIGILPAPERFSGKRRHIVDVLRRLTIIIAAQRIGFTLDEIRQCLGLARDPRTSASASSRSTSSRRSRI